MKKFFITLSFLSVFFFANAQGKVIRDTLPNMLIVTAHPDDWEREIGGTVYLMKDKFNIHIIIASKGERGLSKDPSNETAAIRVKESECGAKMVNATLHFLGKIDGEIYADKEGVDKVVSYIYDLKPAIIFLQWPIDKPDHSAASIMTQMALIKTGYIYDHEIYYFDGGFGGTTNHFVPEIYVNITPVWKVKEQLIRCHACQNKNDEGVKHYEKANRYMGMMNRTDYAEGFIPVYPFTNGRWNSNKKIKCTLLEL